MSYLIDTNVLSELKKRQPHPGVVAWFEQRDPASLFLSVLTLGELRKGIDMMPSDPRKAALLDWLEIELTGFFAGRMLAVDAHVADAWGRLCAAAGRPVPAIDSLLAATALAHGLTLVTRNLVDFQHAGLQVINPWDEAL